MFWKILVVLLISMVPLIELRGAIPVAVGMDLGLPEWLVLLVAIIGNIIPVPIIYLFARKVLEWGSKCKWKTFKKFWGFLELYLLVLVLLPGGLDMKEFGSFCSVYRIAVE